MAFAVDTEEPPPSQWYIDAERIQSALGWFDFDELEYDPIPGVYIDGELVITDGHTRAFLAFLGGATTLDMVQDPDRRELNRPLYRECVSWCRAESVTQIGDRAGRVVNRETFLEEWVSRCETSPHHEGE